jgi:hypothetical protein
MRLSSIAMRRLQFNLNSQTNKLSGLKMIFLKNKLKQSNSKEELEKKKMLVKGHIHRK